MAACGDDTGDGSGGSTSTGTTTTTSSQSGGGSDPTTTTSTTTASGQGGMGQGGNGQGGAGGSGDCSDGGPAYGQECDPAASICGCGVCFGFMGGNIHRCTIPCATDADCPDPATQCNGQGYCGFN
jgi:hypothetical protein